MTHLSRPAAELETAIDKLKELRAYSSQGPWVLEAVGPHFNAHLDTVRVMHAEPRPDAENYDRYIIRDGSYAAEAGGFAKADAELIVALHNTLDIQLAILTGAHRQIRDDGSPDEPGAIEDALALAQAINGGAR